MLKNVTLLLFALLLAACGNSSDSKSDFDDQGAGTPIAETDPPVSGDDSAPDDDYALDDDLPADGDDDTDTEPALVWNQGAFNKTFWQ